VIKKIGLTSHQDPSNDTKAHTSNPFAKSTESGRISTTDSAGRSAAITKQVRLETLATALPLPITFNSRKKTSEVLSLPQLKLKPSGFLLQKRGSRLNLNRMALK